MGKHYGLDIPTLHELRIDVDKQWLDPNGLPREITNLKAIAAAMVQGDIAFRGPNILQRLPPEYGIGYNFLHMQNTGQFLPQWMDIQDLIVYLTGAVNRMVAPPTLAIPIPGIGVQVAAASAPPGKTATPPSLAIPVPTIDKAAAATSVNAVGGAVAHDDDGVDADETAEANSAAINDMTLLQPDGAVADWYALGYAGLYDAVVINVGTAGADITLDTFEYSKGGGSWGTLTPIIMNQLNNWETTGKVWFTFERPGDWAVDTYAGIANMYWIKFKASAIGGGYSQPKGNQAWILVYP